MNTIQFIIGLGLIIVIILLVRLFGAWMLRIDEVIKNQLAILNELKKSNANKGVE